tara:strand:+ start:315 stop:689 length:375 start_codon:yes stop_codon:yes gene_type:complete
MEIIDYVPVLVQIVLALGLGAIIIVASLIFGQRGLSNKFKDSAYECGIAPEENRQVRFSIKFYVTAMLFILFDVEVVFLIPWSLVYREFLASGIAILFPMLFFMSVLVIGLLYEIKKGALEWEK